jgi:hypothetical protein
MGFNLIIEATIRRRDFASYFSDAIHKLHQRLFTVINTLRDCQICFPSPLTIFSADQGTKVNTCIDGGPNIYNFTLVELLRLAY